MKVRRIAASVAMATALLVSAHPSHATDRWSRPYPGVRHLHRTVGPFDYHVLSIDLTDPRVTFVTTPEAVTLPRASDDRPRHHWMQTTTFARMTGADIAINGNYYEISHAKHSTCGFTMSAGSAWHSTYADHRLDCVDSVGFGAHGRVTFFDSSDRLFGPAPEEWMRDVLTGSPRLLRDGEVVIATHPHHALSRNPRTAVGLSRDGHTLYLLVVNGREGHAQGMTCQEAARTLHAAGAWNAVNLDGGGSSSLYIRRERGLVSTSADGFERPVGNHFGIAFRDAPMGDVEPLREPVPRSLVAETAPPRVPLARLKFAKLAALASRSVRDATRGSLATVLSSLAIGAITTRKRRTRSRRP